MSKNLFIRHFCKRNWLKQVKSFCNATLFVGLLLFAASTRASGTVNDTTYREHKDSVETKYNPPASADYRVFSQFNIPVSVSQHDPIILPVEVLTDETAQYRAKALEYEQEVNRRGAFINNLSEMSALKLPVGLTRQVGPLTYTVIISKINGTVAGSFIEAYFLFEIPQTGDKIAFRGNNIAFTNTGGFTGTGRLDLIGSYPIKLNEKTLFTIAGSTDPKVPSKSFVEFDCNGFKQMGVEVALEFSRDLIIPEDEKGKQKPAPERVKTSFTTVIQSWNDLLLGVTIPPFQVNGLKDVGFSVSEAFMDWSDLANPSGIQFPEGYTSPFLTAGQPMAWEGFYLKRLDVKLPPSFAKREGTGRITLGVENMILDNQGFTGKVFVENLLQQGNMSGWAYTIDRVALELITNQVKGFELAGVISVPRVQMKDNETATRFGYRAQRASDGNYIFAVTVQNNLKLPFLMADLNLSTGSSVVVKEKDDKFYPTAILNGDLTIKATSGVKATFNQIRFEGMRISTEEPRFDIQSLGFGSSDQQSISKFPVVISAIAVKKEPKKIGIGFTLTVNIGGKPSEEGFGGSAALTVWGKEEVVQIKNAEGAVIGSDTDWKFDKVELGGVAINIKKPNAYDLAGSINFFDADPIYGDGFRGDLKGTISKFGGLRATALFGRTEQFRYWYADALVTLETGVPLIPGALFATGFGGGFYYKMKQTDKSPGSLIGQTRSGIYYIPDVNSMGIKAIMNIGTARPEAMNGDVGLEVMMNTNGGINSVTLSGNANFMSLAKLAESKMKELASSAAAGKLAEKLAGLMKGQVYGSMVMTFDNVNDVFHGNLEIYVNVAGGLVRGVSDGNKAGWAELHFEKANWYVLIGTPDQPLGLQVAKIFQSRSYFMLGQNLPGSPPPPQGVTDRLGQVDLDYMRDMNSLQSGTGIAFGLHFSVDTGDLRFLMFYGRFQAGTGLDFMLKDYGSEYHCEGSSGTMGINGWYANGQAYAYIACKIGIKVNLKFYKGNYDIINAGAAAILQAKGPNPFWMKGIVGGDYKILGGLVKGKCKFEVTIGKDCKPVGEQNLLDEVKMIAEISPVKGTKDVDVFAAPQIAFNIPVGEVFDITDLENKVHSFRAVLDEFTITDDAKNSVAGTLQWNLSKDVVIFDGHDILPGQKTLNARGKLTFEEKINGVWTKVKFDGKIVEEIAETSFTTGKAPDHIPPSNVLVSYPLTGQVNFYPTEYKQGFIQLKDGQTYLFTPGKEWKQKIRMTNISTFKYIESDLAYNATEKKVTFTMPTGFENTKIYMFEVLNVPAQTTIVDSNVKAVETEIKADPLAGTATLTTKDIQGMLDKREVKTLYSTKFRTSKYNTFGDKFKSIARGQSVRESVARFAFVLYTYMSGDELFDAAELSGLMGSAKLIQMEAVLADNSWYTKYPYPRLYEGYPYNGWKVSRANPSALGVPPSRDITFNNFAQELKLAEGDVSFAPVAFTTSEYVTYNLGQSVDSDYEAIKLQAANYVANKPSLLNPRIEAIIVKPAPFIKYGPYKVKVNYVIPGINKVSSTYEWEFFNYAPDTE